VPRPLPGYILRATLRLGRCRVGGDGPLVMGGQGSGIFLARTMFRSLLNIIPGGRSSPPWSIFFMNVRKEILLVGAVHKERIDMDMFG
jgi:hypothetical protein